MLNLLELCFIFTSYISWQINYQSLVILHLDHSFHSNVFALFLPESHRILIVALHQNLLASCGSSIEHPFTQAMCSEVTLV